MSKNLAKKCIVPQCFNYKHQGQFVGDLCLPCHHTLMDPSSSRHSQLYRNIIAFADSEYQIPELGRLLAKILSKGLQK
jgi:hypothetical protein